MQCIELKYFLQSKYYKHFQMVVLKQNFFCSSVKFHLQILSYNGQCKNPYIFVVYEYA